MRDDPRPTRDSERRLLVVDDEQAVADVIAQVGRELGCTVVVATTFAAFENAIAEFKPEMIVLDLMMPDKDGIELLRYLAAEGSLANILLVSGQAAHLLDAAKRVGTSQRLNICGALEKPLSFSDLDTVLRRAFGLRLPLSSGELEGAVRQGQIVPFFHPKIDLSGQVGAISGAEILARWEHPVYGRLWPADFMMVAERSGAMWDLTESVLVQALEQASAWRSEHALHLPLALNLSAVSLTDLKLPDRLEKVVEEYSFRSSSVTLELTESATAGDAPDSVDILSRLRLKGFNLAMDDFGTGYASMAQLVRLPFNELKIDRSFVSELGHRQESEIVVRCTVSLAHGLGMKVCAEGVQTREALELLRALGCDTAQGTLIGEPMPGNAVVPFVLEWQRRGMREMPNN